MYQILDKKYEKSAAEFTGSILNAGLSSDSLGELRPLLDLMGEFKLIVPSAHFANNREGHTATFL